MPIAVSTIADVGAPQSDGRFWVTEAHVADDGTRQTFAYLCSKGFDYRAALTKRAAALNEEEASRPPPDMIAAKIDAARGALDSADFSRAKQLLGEAATLFDGKMDSAPVEASAAAVKG